MRFLLVLFSLFVSMCTTPAFAGFAAYNGTSDLKLFNVIQCNTGLTCSRVKDRLQINVNGGTSASTLTRWMNFKQTALNAGTSTQGVATSVFVTQVYIPVQTTLTGIAVNNAGTVGTNKYIVALFNSAGAAVANSALAGVTTSGATSYQSVPFTSTYAVTAPGVYWIAVYMNGATDNFYTIPAAGAYAGLAGTVTGQTFGTISNLTLPTTFTAGTGPIAFTY